MRNPQQEMKELMEKMDVKFMITKTLDHSAKEAEEMMIAVISAIESFKACDWGEVPVEDKLANNKDLEERDGHVLARYNTPQGDIYINLDFYPDGNNYATLMFCDEY